MSVDAIWYSGGADGVKMDKAAWACNLKGRGSRRRRNWAAPTGRDEPSCASHAGEEHLDALRRIAALRDPGPDPGSPFPVPH